VHRLGGHGQRVRLVHHQRVAGGLAGQRHRDVDLDLLATLDDDQVHVLVGVLDRVTLDRLGQGQRRAGATGHVDREHLVEATVPDRRGELPGRKRDMNGCFAVAVQHSGHQAGPARAAGTTLAELGAGLGADLYLGHGETPETVGSGCV
jgi:hypothetical protein